MIASLKTAPTLAHARMLQERPTAAGGERVAVAQALSLLTSGQFVNGTFTSGHSLPEALGPVEVPRLGLADLEAGPAAERSVRVAAEVLIVHPEEQELTLGLGSLPVVVSPGDQVLIDFTDVSGTYQLLATSATIHPGILVALALVVRWAVRRQLRRFVRVPVTIPLDSFEAQQEDGTWRMVAAQVIDLSLGGMGLLVGEPLAAGTRVRATVPLPGRFGPMGISGHVVAPPGPAEARDGVRHLSGQLVRRGIAFEPLPNEELQRLQRALYQRQVELRRLGEPALRSLSSVAVAGAAGSAPPTPTAAHLPAGVRRRWRLW